MRAAIVSFGCLAMILSACGAVLDIPSSVTESDKAPTVDGGGDGDAMSIDTGVDAACPPPTDTDMCFRCTDINCCHEYDSCAADPRCGSYYKECLPNCKAAGNSYDQCVLNCDSTNGAGHAEFLPFFACGELHCLAECSNGAPDPCTQCLFSSCRDQIDTCSRDRQCDTLRSCANLCNTAADQPSCVRACTTSTSAQSQDEFNAVTTCSLQFCSDRC